MYDDYRSQLASLIGYLADMKEDDSISFEEQDAAFAAHQKACELRMWLGVCNTLAKGDDPWKS